MSVWCLDHRATAQTSETPPTAAVEHYHRGRDHYQAGRYREALSELERALSLDPRSPNLVYNVARVHELLGELEEASRFYTRYRDMLPVNETEERARVDAILLRLEGAKDQVDPPADEALREPEAPVPMERGLADGTFWTIAGLGASALVASAVAGGLALREEKQASRFVIGRDGDASGHGEHVRRADRLALSSDVTLIIGSTLAVTSVLLYMLRERPADEDRLAKRRTRVGVGAWSSGFAVTFGANL
jgi:tetratricopeptide (TPR) repeat protein